MDTEIVRDQFYQLNVCRSMWSDVIHHRVVEELVDVTTGYFSMVYQGSGESEEVPTDWKLGQQCSDVQEGPEGRPRNLSTCESNLSIWKDYGEDHTVFC